MTMAYDFGLHPRASSESDKATSGDIKARSWDDSASIIQSAWLAERLCGSPSLGKSEANLSSGGPFGSRLESQASASGGGRNGKGSSLSPRRQVLKMCQIAGDFWLAIARPLCT